MIHFQTAKYADVTASAENSITLRGKANTEYKLRISHFLQFAVWGGPNAYADASTTLSLSQVLRRAYTSSADSSIIFSTEIENIPNSDNDFGFTQQFTIEVIRRREGGVSFLSEATRAGSIFRRSAADSVNFGSNAIAYMHYSARYTIEGTGGTGTPAEEPGAPIDVVYDVTFDEHGLPVCHLADCSGRRVTFEYNGTVLSLRAPATSQKLINNTIENTNRSGEPLQACIYPMFTVLSLTFSGINRADKDAFNQFIRDTAALEIVYTDNCGDIWDGAIISDTINIEQDGNGFECPEGSGSYSFSFDFEGTKR